MSLLDSIHMAHVINKRTECTGVIIKCTTHNEYEYIFIQYAGESLSDIKHQYPFPDCFTDRGVLRLIDKPELSLRLQAECKSHTCNACGEYTRDIVLRKGIPFCNKCAPQMLECNMCKQLVYETSGKFTYNDKFLCRACYDRIFPPRHVDFTSTSTSKLVLIYKIFPYSCKKYHEVENVLAKVVCSKYDKRSIQELNMQYCKTCRKYFILKASMENYRNAYGFLLFPKRDMTRQTNGDGYIHFNPDSILSRWGYTAKDGYLTRAERRAILSFLMDDNGSHKSEIIHLLTSFLNLREYRCRDAARIWREDLDFVNQYKIHRQRIVDLTKKSETLS